VIYVSPGQINVQAPSLGAPGPGRLEVQSPAGAVEADVSIVEYAPAIFLLKGYGAVLHSGDVPVTAASPARAGETVTMLCVRTVVRSGEVPLFYRVEFAIPDSVAGSRVPVELTIGGVRSNTVTLPIQ
jgi:hypothetical protein